ncbi:hypothetical protein PYW08_016596 [Mythimna loreyi]|uniref:Uncharacterized protein n=1 Tax=Mythimna loreyi TaxID=667449 RepID=A0ACC2QY12_9NEOP|nr:hypothetical protein PYW08_016596 [Mythimna loreyi]
MRSVIVLLILAIVILALANAIRIGQCQTEPKRVFYDLKDAPALFEKFIKDYKKHYKNAQDKRIHYLAFVESLVKINKNNEMSIKEGPQSAVFGISNFSDWTDEEFHRMADGLKHPPSNWGRK